MRWIFYTLLTVNLGILLWYTQIEVSQHKTHLPAPPAGVKQLLLLSEHLAADKMLQAPPASQDMGTEDVENSIENVSPQIPTIEISNAPEVIVKLPARVCNTIGPFKQEQRIKEAEKRLQEIGFITGRRSKIEQELFGYRVYLPPLENKEAAKEVTRELDKSDVRDYFIIHGEEDKRNGISLGLFRNKNGAIRRMAQVRRFGFKPVMEIRNREQTIYWLDIQAEGEQFSDAIWRELFEGQPELQRLGRECEKEQE